MLARPLRWLETIICLHRPRLQVGRLHVGAPDARGQARFGRGLPSKRKQRARVSAGVPADSIRGQSRSPSVMASCAIAIAAVASEASFVRALIRANRVARSA